MEIPLPKMIETKNHLLQCKTMISKKVRELFSSLMEAFDNNSAVTFDNETDQYTGYFNGSVVNKFINEGVLELVNNNGADYSASPFGFTIGFEHFLHMNKKPRNLIGYLCYGFIDDKTDEIHPQ